MRYISTLLALLFIQLSLIANNCNCPPLPPDPGITEIVSNVAELNAAMSNASSNNGNYTILLEDGVYTLTSNLLYINTHMENLTIRSLSGNRDAVTIQGQGMNGGVTHIFLVAAKGFTCADMTIGGIFYHAIQIQGENDADDCLIQNVRFFDCNEQMLKISGGSSNPNYADNGVVQCCVFEFTAGIGNQWYTGGIDGHHCRNWEVRYNEFYHIRSPESALAEHAIHFWSESVNTLVENNVIINCDRGIGYGLTNSAGRGHFGGIIRNNIVHTSRDVGIGLEQARNALVYNNTVYTENYFNSIEYRFDSTYNCHIANNLTNENIASRNGGTALVESNYITSDNSFYVDAAGYDFHLALAEPNIVDMGIILPGVTDDVDCENRPMGGGVDIGADEYFVEVPPVNVPIKVLLEGPFNPVTGLMNTILLDEIMLPLEQPYNRPPWNYDGGEQLNSYGEFPINTVDWLLIEVRDASDNFNILSQKAALLLSDGTVLDGQSLSAFGVEFTNISGGANYYISVKSRNHLAIMSASSVTIPPPVTYDFTIPANVADGSNQLADLGNGIFGLKAGDFTSDGTITIADFNLYNTQASLINFYVDADVNMDKTVSVADFNLFQINSSAIGVEQIRY